MVREKLTIPSKAGNTCEISCFTLHEIIIANYSLLSYDYIFVATLPDRSLSTMSLFTRSSPSPLKRASFFSTGPTTVRKSIIKSMIGKQARWHHDGSASAQADSRTRRGTWCMVDSIWHFVLDIRYQLPHFRGGTQTA